MAFSQQRFLNATVTGFSGSMGWGESPSQVTVNLVNDPAIGDDFSPGNVGRPVTFVFNNFTFTGILQSYGESASTGGFTQECTIVDPRDFLAKTPLILDGYLGAVTTNNILNVYGYLESFGFGNSLKNESGIPWKLIRNAVHAMTQATQQGTYGGPLYFISSRYMVDLTSLPNVPEDYRVGSDSITLLDFISEICEAGGCDYYINSVETTPGIFVIKVNTVSRTAPINYGAITSFISAIAEYEDKSIGRELTNEVTSKMVIGGPVRELYYQYGDLTVNTIWPFWGYDLNGVPIIGEGYGNNHTFVLDSRSVNNPRVGPFYQTDVGEMRAVLGGRATWETFLILQGGMGGIHDAKASTIGIIGYVANINGRQLLQHLITSYNNSPGDENTKTVRLDMIADFFPHTRQNQLDYDQLDVETGYLYDFLFQIASEYFGKKFMVSIPNVSTAYEPDTGKIRVSQTPVDSAYLSEADWPIAISNNLLSVEVDKFSEEDGKIVCYVRFDNAGVLDLSELSPDDVGFNSTVPNYGQNKLKGYAVFVKASVEERVIYLDPENQIGPRAVVTLPGVVHERVVSNDFSSKQIIVDFVNGGFSAAGIDITSDAYKTNVLNKVIGHVAQDVLNYGTSTTAVIPNLAVVPMESNTLRYGPWSSQGSPGGVDYEVDDSLVPWNYGGFEAMNIVANAKVTSAIGTNQQLEQGSVTFPDVPFHNLGEPLALGGPIVSDVTVSIDSGGAHTTYKFHRTVKQPRYGQAKAERVGKLARTSQQMRRNLRIAAQPQRRPDISLTKKPIVLDTKLGHPKNNKTSSHEMLVGQTFTDNDGNKTSSVFLQSDYNFIGHSQYDYANKAFMSLDGLLQPYEVNPSGVSSLSRFTSPKSGATTPTVNELSPFSTFGNTTAPSEFPPSIKVVAKDQSIPSSLFGASQSGDYRAIALRAPLVLSGFGFNADGESVGNRLDQSSWKTGPVDLRWDDDRGIWGPPPGGGGGLVRARATTFIGPGSPGSGTLANGTPIVVTPWLGQPVCSGDNLFLSKEGDSYYLVLSSFKAVNVVNSIACSPSGQLLVTNKSIYLPGPISSGGGFVC